MRLNVQDRHRIPEGQRRPPEVFEPYQKLRAGGRDHLLRYVLVHPRLASGDGHAGDLDLVADGAHGEQRIRDPKTDPTKRPVPEGIHVMANTTIQLGERQRIEPGPRSGRKSSGATLGSPSFAESLVRASGDPDCIPTNV